MPKKPAELPTPSDRPEADVVLYDGHCNFCRASVRRLAWWDCQGKLAYLSMHAPLVQERWPDISHDRLMREMCLIERDSASQPGQRHWGPDAFRYLTRRLRRLWWLMPVLYFPGAMIAIRPLYRLIANNRYLIAGKSEDCDDGACSMHR